MLNKLILKNGEEVNLTGSLVKDKPAIFSRPYLDLRELFYSFGTNFYSVNFITREITINGKLINLTGVLCSNIRFIHFDRIIAEVGTGTEIIDEMRGIGFQFNHNGKNIKKILILNKNGEVDIE